MEIEYYFHSTAYFYGSGDHEFCQDGYELNGEVCTKTEEKEVTVTEYRYSTRSCVGGKSQKEWSLDENDLNLKSQGFSRTGRKRLYVITK